MIALYSVKLEPEMRKTPTYWLSAGLIAVCLLPWYAVQGGFFSFEWLLSDFGSKESASALGQVLFHGKWWLLAAVLPLIALAVLLSRKQAPQVLAKSMVIVAALGIFAIVVQAFSIGRTGPEFFVGLLSQGPAAEGQTGFGAGAMVVLVSLLFVLTSGISGMGKGRGDIFVVGLIGLIIALVGTFVFFPVSRILVQAFETDDGYSLSQFLGNYFDPEMWSLSCLTLSGHCGPIWNTLFLGIMVGAGTTALGLAFALIATRTQFRAKFLLRVLSILPIVTPPFVIGLALILLFGRAGLVSNVLYDYFDIEKSRWLYGFTGLFIAQMLSFTPIAFLVLIGIVEGVSPSMEEASQTLNGSRWQTFRHVTFPLIRPGLANTFILGFIESAADFGNPLVLGGNYGVLSTEISYAIIGAVTSPEKAATVAIMLLTLTLSAFMVQRLWLGKKSYATVTGKADSGQHSSLNPVLRFFCYATALPWAAFSAVVYSMIIFGSFVKLWGYDNTFTLAHYIKAFGIEFDNGIHWNGVAWDSYFTTLRIASIAAPLTALVGLATAYLLVRQRFAGKALFEFSTMLSFAIPGTVIGVSYIMAFNVPPIELTGTGIILIIVFVFRNMPVGVRGGIAAMSQLDKSLDEASITLGANSFTTVRKVILPLIGPAILAALAYSFVRAITSVSAVIFLVSAEHNMATSFIVGSVENGDFGLAIAYCAVLIVTMLLAIMIMQLVIGKRKLRRENRVQSQSKLHKLQARDA
ncbi:iron ABC transporter permease [Pseudophaeobacter sp.]|uniref:ABC transporter permease n=1 Tax=Pseudophaeobacter sp. TaxID=1971739 RepID=UPI0032983E78